MGEVKKGRLVFGALFKEIASEQHGSCFVVGSDSLLGYVCNWPTF